MKSMKSMERTESLRLREGGDTRPDQTQDDTSSGQAKRHDIIQGLNQFSEPQQHKTEQQKEKGIMTLEMEMKDLQDKKEKWDKNEGYAIQEIIEERDGITSLQSEIRLGYQEGLRGGCNVCDAIQTTLTEAQNQKNHHAQQYETITAQTRQDGVQRTEEALHHYRENMRLVDVVATIQRALTQTRANLHSSE